MLLVTLLASAFVFYPLSSQAEGLLASRTQMIKKLNQGYSSKLRTGPVQKKSTLLGCANYEVKLYSQDPVSLNERIVEISVFKPVGVKADRAVLIVPPTGGENNIDRAYAYLFCHDKFDVVIVSNWSHLDEVSADFGSHDRATRRAVTAIRNAIDYIQKPVGILGTSLGALFTSATLSVEPRIKAALLIVGGAPVAEVFTQSDHRKIRRIRDRVMKEAGIASIEEYEERLKQAIQIKIEELANPHPPFALKMFISKNDRTVGTQYQYLLRAAWGNPETVEMNQGHVGGVLEAYAHHHAAIRRFFRQNLRVH